MVGMEGFLELAAETFISMNFVIGQIHLKEGNRSEVLTELA
jgi:hypothetical protein